MPEKVLQNLQGVSETLLITLYARARETQRPGGLLKDPLAVTMVEQIDCDFSRLTMQRHDEVALVMRMHQFDEHARAFLACNPHAAVIHIGCGLDTRFERVDDGRVTWFDLDLPDVIALRRRLIPADCPRHRSLAASVFDPAWMDEVDAVHPRSVMFLAEGVLPYFTEAQVKSLFLLLRDRFPGCELVCDAHTPLAARLDNLHLVFARVQARLQWGLQHGRDVERWGAGLHLLDEWNYLTDPDSPFKQFLWVRLLPSLARSSGIFHYRLGVSDRGNP